MVCPGWTAVRIIFRIKKVQKSSDAVRLRVLVLGFEENVLSTDDLVLLCNVCGVKIAYEKKFTLRQHITSGNNFRALRRDETRG